jgi:hypothetical protein
MADVRVGRCVKTPATGGMYNHLEEIAHMESNDAAF